MKYLPFIKVLGIVVLTGSWSGLLPNQAVPVEQPRSRSPLADSPEIPAQIMAQGFMRDRPTFFEEGNDRLEEEIDRLEERQPSPTLTISTGVNTWQPIVSRAGGFAIWVPMGIWTDEAEILETTLGQIDFKVFATHSGGDRLIVAYSDPLSLDSDAPQILTAVREAIASRTDFETVHSQSITLNSCPGEASELRNTDQAIDVRVYWAHDRIYILGVQHPIEEAQSPTINAFFDSFQLL